MIQSASPVVLIVDDSDIPLYKQGFELLASHGIRPIHFWGLKQGQLFKCCTSICLSSHPHGFSVIAPSEHSSLFGFSPFQRDPRWMLGTEVGRTWRGEG